MKSPVAMALCVSAILSAAPAQAADTISYAVTSDSIGQVDVEYVDQAGRHLVQGISLPWRLEVSLADAAGPTGPGAQIRADWRPAARPARWVAVSISRNGKLVCQSTLDVGNATCYGNTPHIS